MNPKTPPGASTMAIFSLVAELCKGTTMGFTLLQRSQNSDTGCTHHSCASLELERWKELRLDFSKIHPLG